MFFSTQILLFSIINNRVKPKNEHESPRTSCDVRKKLRLYFFLSSNALYIYYIYYTTIFLHHQISVKSHSKSDRNLLSFPVNIASMAQISMT